MAAQWLALFSSASKDIQQLICVNMSVNGCLFPHDPVQDKRLQMMDG